MKNLDNILEIASILVKEGKATIENAVEKAIEYDNNLCEQTLIRFQRKGYRSKVRLEDKIDKGIGVVCDSLLGRIRGGKE